MRSRPLLFAALFIAGFTLMVFADTYPRQPAIDALHYRFFFTVSDDSPRIEGETTATLRLVAPAGEVLFDLKSEAAGKGMTVSRVTSGDRDVTFEHRADRLRVMVPENVQPGTDISFTIRYSGVPADGMVPLNNMHGERVWFSEGWPNKLRNWLPVVDHPSDKATCEIYQKGGWVLHLLRQEIGLEAFWTGIRDYYRRYRDGNASTDELREVMEHAAGGKDLRWFFDQWLRRPGVPRVAGSWRYDVSKKVLEVTLTQTQASTPFRLNVEVGVETSADDPLRVEHVELNATRKTVSWPLTAAPKAVVLDPNTTLLAEVTPLERVQ